MRIIPAAPVLLFIAGVCFLLLALSAIPAIAEQNSTFRVGPTVKLRPLNDVITKSSDGLIELYMKNPSLNEIVLNVEARISVPAGIHVYGEGFGQAEGGGVVYGSFDVPPGKVRTIYINIKAEKTGDFYTHFSGMYWPGDNKEAYNPISLTHPLKVYEPSRDPENPKPSSTAGQELPYSYIILAAVILGGIALIIGFGRKPPKTEVSFEQ